MLKFYYIFTNVPIPLFRRGMYFPKAQPQLIPKIDMLKTDMLTFGFEYRVASLSKRYTNAQGVVLVSLKLVGQL